MNEDTKPIIEQTMNIAGRRKSTVTTPQAETPTAHAQGGLLPLAKPSLGQRTTPGKDDQRGSSIDPRHHQPTGVIWTTTPAHTSSVSTRPCEVISADELGSLIKDQDWLREKCRELNSCAEELYKSGSIYRILAGADIKLRDMCGLLYPNVKDRFRPPDSQCSDSGRESLRQEMGEDLSSGLKMPLNAGRDSWGKLGACLDSSPDDDEMHMDKVCRLKGNSTRPLCNSTDVEITTEHFLNVQLRELHCSCTAVAAETSHSSLVALVGGACGGALMIFIAIVLLVVLCVRHRRLKRHQTEENKYSENVTSPFEDPCPTYEQIGDLAERSDAWTKQNKSEHRPVHKAPPLPSRSAPHQFPTGTSANEYLELLPDSNYLQPRQVLHEEPPSRETFGGQSALQGCLYQLAKPVSPSPTAERRTNPGDNRLGEPGGPKEEATYFEKIDWSSLRTSKDIGDYSELNSNPVL